MKRWLALVLCCAVTACADAMLEHPEPAPIDYNEDGRIGFSDLERGYPPQPLIDHDQALMDHLDKQDPDYPDHFR